MFPPTDSLRSAFDLFPTTDNVKDINPPRSLHVETCVLLYNKEYYEKEVKGKVKAEVVTEV
jgi:hypothetical protein